jgi:CheY-like chemotaxis protein
MELCTPFDRLRRRLRTLLRIRSSIIVSLIIVEAPKECQLSVPGECQISAKFPLPLSYVIIELPWRGLKSRSQGSNISAPLILNLTMSTESEFLQQVRDALHHLYDYPYLEAHPLAQRYWPESEQLGPNRAQRLHRLLLESIEELHPPNAPAKGTSRTEYYFLLVYRYVEEWPLPNIMQELGYSRRQFFRQQQKALEMLTGLLQEKAPKYEPPKVELDNVLNDELERFRSRRRAVDLVEVVEGVVEMVGPLIKAHEVTLTSHLQTGIPLIYSSRTLLRQVFLNALSHLITQPGSQQIEVYLAHDNQLIRVELIASFVSSSLNQVEIGPQRSELESVRYLVELIGGNWQPPETETQKRVYRFDLPVNVEKSVLVVEDNEAVIQAFRRYLTGYNYEVIGATTAGEALRLAQEIGPTVITLDVMIPGQDGWEILHALKHNTTTQHIPVIICSVLEDPDLARSLGAADYLRKPVAQADLLTMLNRVSGVL